MGIKKRLALLFGLNAFVVLAWQNVQAQCFVQSMTSCQELFDSTPSPGCNGPCPIIGANCGTYYDGDIANDWVDTIRPPIPDEGGQDDFSSDPESPHDCWVIYDCGCERQWVDSQNRYVMLCLAWGNEIGPYTLNSVYITGNYCSGDTGDGEGEGEGET